MSNDEILGRIDEIVAEEHRLRSQGHPLTQEEQALLREHEARLDQLWDLLRRRDARRRAGADPDAAAEQPQSQVESYLQ